jgi:small subunit ribosomal protein S10e
LARAAPALAVETLSAHPHRVRAPQSAAMIITKKNRLAIYSELFKEGVIVTHKSKFVKKHMKLDVPNLDVIKSMQSLLSRGHVKEVHNWHYLYYTLTDTGIAYLRQYLHLPDDVVPDTLQRKARANAQPSFRQLEGGDDRRGPRRGDREGYRGPREEAGGFRGRGRGGFRGRGRGAGLGAGAGAGAAAAPAAPAQ